MQLNKIKIGFGYDVHKLKVGESLILGGVKINSELGTVGHSDADVLIHSICDALLGAANLRDIGFHFPDNSSKYKDIDSTILLKETLSLLKEKNYKIGNIDTTICLEKPKLKDYIEDIKSSLSKVLEIDIDDVSIKATTTEKLGFVGKLEGISVHAVALIFK